MNDDCHWTDAQISTLSTLWDSGMSASAIGDAIGVSKNAVIGKARRLRLPPRPLPIKRLPAGQADARRVHRAAASVPPSMALPVEPVVAQPAVTQSAPCATVAVRVEHTPPQQAVRPDPVCAWPLWGHGERATHVYCGAARVQGTPYCPMHHAKAYRAREAVE